MNTSLHFEPRVKQDGRCAIYIRIQQAGKKVLLHTSAELKSLKDWNKTNPQSPVKKSEPNYAKLNDYLRSQRAKVEQIIRELEQKDICTLQNIKGKYYGVDCGNLLEYCRKSITQSRQTKATNTLQKYITFERKLSDFIKSNYHCEDISLKQVDAKFNNDFIVYLNTIPNSRGGKLQPNTIAKHIKILKALLNKAKDEGYIEANPIKNTPKEITPHKETLTKAEITSLIELDIEAKTPQWDARNIFLFSICVGGMRAGDCLQLRWKDITPDGRLHYTMSKNGKSCDMELCQMAKQILDCYRKDNIRPNEYIFPYLKNNAQYSAKDRFSLKPDLAEKLTFDIHNNNQKINNRLKIVTKRAGIEKNITMHIARHIFARIAREEGVSSYALKDILHHSKLQTTETYLGGIDMNETDSAMTKVTDALFTPSTKKDNVSSLLEGLTIEQKKNLLEELTKSLN